MESVESTSEANAGPSLMRRLARLAAVLLIVLALALTPPLLNVERLRHRIAASMSESLGRPVHIDSVTLHLLPMPGFTLTNVVVSEDPEFGSEPTIRAMTVEATLRPSSLWRRQVEISKVKFVEPSLNLVRNSQGRWNLQSLLMHAAGVPTAPTEQVKAGPAPRFPYIEATNGRVNLKMGEEKKAFSLTDADFALWLPSPQIWRVRLVGKPARTDTSITDPGEIRLEGSLERAATMTEVPVDLRASWHSAPLGEASKVLTGADAGWRGMLTVDAELVGPLGSAKLATKVTLNELRRADFVPARSLDLQADCTATVNVATAVATSPQCQLPVAPAAGVSAVADSIDLTSLRMTGLRVGTPGLDEDWLLDWARLFLQKIPTAEHTGGIVQGSLVRAGDGTGWQGSLEGTVPTLSGRDDATRAGISLMGGVDELVLAPTNLVASGSAPLILSGSVSAQGYTLTLAGTGTVAQVRQLMGFLPPVGEGLEKLVEDSKSDVPQRMDFTCSRAWGGSESCASNVAAEQKGRGRR